mmetsp:Transcript_7111/g.9915  ORF Transcript_7111/g.9915 Transcript_7111/m.9915 type:complete len:300 (+) Transcript_7111:182-1081(+)
MNIQQERMNLGAPNQFLQHIPFSLPSVRRTSFGTICLTPNSAPDTGANANALYFNHRSTHLRFRELCSRNDRNGCLKRVFQPKFSEVSPFAGDWIRHCSWRSPHYEFNQEGSRLCKLQSKQKHMERHSGKREHARASPTIEKASLYSILPVLPISYLEYLFLSVAIVIHELGHYAASRVFGVYVCEFSLGIGPEVYRFPGTEKRERRRDVTSGTKLNNDMDNLNKNCEKERPGPRFRKGVDIVWRAFPFGGSVGYPKPSESYTDELPANDDPDRLENKERGRERKREKERKFPCLLPTI